MKNYGVYAVVGVAIAALVLIIFADNASASSSPIGLSFGSCSGCSPTGQTSNQNGEICDVYDCNQGSVCVGVSTGAAYGC